MDKVKDQFYLDRDILEWLRETAKKEGRSKSGQLNYLLRKLKEAL